MICLVCKMLEQYEKKKLRMDGWPDGQADGRTEQDNNNLSKFYFEMCTVSKIEHLYL